MTVHLETGKKTPQKPILEALSVSVGEECGFEPEEVRSLPQFIFVSRKPDSGGELQGGIRV
jgi:hypothetical protein